MQYFLETIKRVGIFIICSQVLIHLRPRAVYEQYFKMLVNAMILLQIFMPVAEVWFVKDGGNLQDGVAWFERELQEFDAFMKTHVKEEKTGTEWERDIAESGKKAERKEIFKVRIAPIETIWRIQISAGKGGMSYADVSGGEPEGKSREEMVFER